MRTRRKGHQCELEAERNQNIERKGQKCELTMERSKRRDSDQVKYRWKETRTSREKVSIVDG